MPISKIGQTNKKLLKKTRSSFFLLIIWESEFVRLFPVFISQFVPPPPAGIGNEHRIDRIEVQTPIRHRTQPTASRLLSDQKREMECIFPPSKSNFCFFLCQGHLELHLFISAFFTKGAQIYQTRWPKTAQQFIVLSIPVMPEFFPFYIDTFIVPPSQAFRRVKRNLRSLRPSPN